MWRQRAGKKSTLRDLRVLVPLQTGDGISAREWRACRRYRGDDVSSSNGLMPSMCLTVRV